MSPNRDPTPADLSIQIQRGVKKREDYTSSGLRIRQMFIGESFSASLGSAVEDPLQFNIPYEYITNTIANMMYANPRVDCTSDGVNTPESESVQAAINTLLPKINFEVTGTLCAFDGMCDFWVGVVLLEPTPDLDPQIDTITGAQYVPMRPTFVRIPPSRFVCDPAWMGMGEPMFQGHLVIKDRQDMLDEKNDDGSPVYNAELIKSLQGNEAINAVMRDMLNGCGIENVEKDDVAYWEIFMPGTRKIYTVAIGGTSEWLREPREFKGSSKGPYIMGGIHDVPDSLYPMSPMQAMIALVERVNAIADKLDAEISTAKSIAIIDEALQSAAKTIKNCNTGDVLVIAGFTKGMIEKLEIGGPNPVTAGYLQEMLARVDRLAGVTSNQRGESSSETATADAIKEKYTKIREEAIKKKWRLFIVDVLERMVELLHRSPHVSFYVLTDDDSGNKVSRMFLGGPLPGEDDSIQPQITIEPYSMEYVPDGIQQKRIQDATAIIINVAPLIPQMPWVKWRNLLDDAFRANNVPNGARRYIDFDMLTQSIGMAATQPTKPGDDNAPDQPAQAAPSGAPGQGLPAPMGGPGQGMQSNASRGEQLSNNVLQPKGLAQ